ncbi:unnamed protein product [Rotaria magnacalcarata]|uniref:Uncharacterized protein n=1 Tax=Rotaria magnacalcarata TaxID=392030 RepID=A0A8S2KZW1_9BILA|nr:unnamed protein product [Rotaria magnacalcarata]
MARISIVMFIQLAACISISHAALTCYSCTNCGITWNDSKATIVQTSGSGDYCRKAVAGVVINRDFSSSCSSANVLGHGIFCCETDLCVLPTLVSGLECYYCATCTKPFSANGAIIVSSNTTGESCYKIAAAVTTSRGIMPGCVSASVLGIGTWCCNTDLCNAGQSIVPMNLKIIILAFLICIGLMKMF